MNESPTTSIRWRRPAMEALFILTECIAWYIVLVAMATTMERAFLLRMEDRLDMAIRVSDAADPARAEATLAALGMTTVATSGPTLLAVVLAGVAGFALMRLLRRLDIHGGLGSTLMIASTIVGVNVLLHLAVRGDMRVWDASALVDLVAGPEARYAGADGLDAFVADPSLGNPHGDALALSLAGLTAVWVRFMLAGRSEVTLERMARSFTGSFIVVLLAMVIATAGGVGVPSVWIVVQFALGMLGLAVANHHRALPTEESASRTTAWVTSVGATVGLLLGSAGLVGLLAVLHFEVVLRAMGSVLVAVLVILLTIIITPIYWLFDQIFQLIFNGRTLEDSLPQIPEFRLMEALAEQSDGSDGFHFPLWLTDGLKFLLLSLAIYAAYRIGRRLISPRRPPPGDYDEARTRSSGGASVGELLAGLLRLPGRDRSDDWMGRHRAYALYGQMLAAGAERGLARLPTETPREYAATAARLLDAEPFGRIELLFERARFGRRFPPAREIDVLRDELRRWDQTNPPSEEQRERMRGARRMSAGEELDLQIQRAKETVRDGRMNDPLF